MHTLVKLLQVLLLPPSHVLIDSPVVHLFIEHVLGILVVKLWEHLSIVSQIIDQGLEGFAVSIEEYLLVDLLELMHIREQLGEGGSLHGAEYFLFGLDVSGTSDINRYDLAIVLVESLDLFLLDLPGILLDLDGSILLVQVVLHFDVPVH